MQLLWLFSTCQYLLFTCVIACSTRLCLKVRRSRPSAPPPRPWTVSAALRFALGTVGALGGAVEFPVTAVLTRRRPACLYTCITLVCGPVLVRHFTMCLVLLLTLDLHLQHVLAHRYPAVVTRRRALCAALLGWVASVLSAFAQFIGPDVLRGPGGVDGGSVGLGLGDNWTATSPPTTKHPEFHRDVKLIGRFLPYGGFLSKFYVEDMHNFTYAQLHSGHWGVCSADGLLSPAVLVYVHGVTVFLLPLVSLLVVYLNLLRLKPKESAVLSESSFPQLRFVALSILFLVVLCAPVHMVHCVALFSPRTAVPSWAHGAASYLFQVYAVAPPLLFTPQKKSGDVGPAEAFSVPAEAFSVPAAPTPVHASGGGAGPKVLCQWASAKNALRAKVCPGP